MTMIKLMTMVVNYSAPYYNSEISFKCFFSHIFGAFLKVKEGFRKLNQTLRITHFWPPCGARNSNNYSNLSQHHTCRCPSAFVAGTSAGIMLTIWDLQRVETDWPVSVWFNFRKPSFYLPFPDTTVESPIEIIAAVCVLVLLLAIIGLILLIR